MEFNIRKNGMKILAQIYQDCDLSFAINDMNIEPLFPKQNDRWRYINYLRGSAYITNLRYDHPGMKIISCEITSRGINAIEDYMSQEFSVQQPSFM